jgi:hypothetical protein
MVEMWAARCSVSVSEIDIAFNDSLGVCPNKQSKQFNARDGRNVDSFRWV